jgi:Uma2 family endonuclease
MMRSQRGGVADEVITLEEFQRMPEEDEFLIELVRGRVVREPRPGIQHGRVTAELGSRIYACASERGLGITVIGTGFLLSVDPPTVRGPDVAFVAAENLPGGSIPQGFLTTAPHLAVEVVSPSNTAAEIQEKVLEYLANGTRLVWVVDPVTRSVAAYRSREDIRLLTEGDVLEGADVLPGFRVTIAELFEPFHPRKS